MQTHLQFAGYLVILALSGSLLQAEELTLEQAIQLALEHNRGIQNAALDTAKVGDRLRALKTHLLPSANFYALGSQQLGRVDFTVDRGSLGTYPGVGPLPDHDVRFRTPLRPTGFLFGRVSQPLSTIYRIRLNVKLLDISSRLAQEQARSQRQDVIRNVKRLYYTIQQVESSLRATRETVKLYQEINRLTANYVAQQAALKADYLEVQTRLAKVEQAELSLMNQEATLQEQLNQLLGRDVLAEFTVSAVVESPDLQSDLAAARQKALEQRPEIRQARLRIEHAQQDLRAKRSEYIPDIAAEFNTLALLNFSSFLPLQSSSVGFSLSWEPFDWGRKKSEMAEKRRTIEQALNSEADARSAVLIDVNDRFRQLQQSRSQFRVARLSQETALENLGVAKQKYEVQAALLKDVLQAQANLQQANADYQQALAAFWAARAEFEHALGEDP